MTNLETQTAEATSKSWEELQAEGKNPINFIGTMELDESTVPDGKRALFKTIVNAELSEIDAKAEQEAIQRQEKNNAFRVTLSAELERKKNAREKAQQGLTGIAVRGSIVAAINDQAEPKAPSTIGTYNDGYLPPREQEDLLEARRNGTPL